MQSRYEHMAWEELNGYVIVLYDNVWWIAYILEKDAEKSMVCVSFLHPKGPSKSFYFPENGDVLRVPKDNILTKVNPTTTTGRFYVLTTDEANCASESLKVRLEVAHH